MHERNEEIYKTIVGNAEHDVIGKIRWLVNLTEDEMKDAGYCGTWELILTIRDEITRLDRVISSVRSDLA